MNGQYLVNGTSEKLLGVTLNHNLLLETHISCVISKVNSKLALLRRIKGCLPIETHKLFKGKAIRSPENRTHNLLSHPKWMCIQDRINYRQITMVFKSINGISSQHMSNMFNFATNRESTRQYNRKVLTVPPGKHKVVFEQSYRYISVQFWKKVKPEIRDSCSLNTFKLNYLKDYFHNV